MHAVSAIFFASVYVLMNIFVRYVIGLYSVELHAHNTISMQR